MAWKTVRKHLINQVLMLWVALVIRKQILEMSQQNVDMTYKKKLYAVWLILPPCERI